MEIGENNDILNQRENVKLTIEEINKAREKHNLPVYYKYRYTFGKTEQELTEQQRVLKRIVDFIKSHYLLGDKLTAGIEHYTKGMVTCKPHAHIHFISKQSSDTIRKGIMREFDLIGRCQSCKAEVMVDESKFWRYPLKQQKDNSYKAVMIKGFSQEEASLMRDVAYEQWKLSAEVLVGKLEKKLEKTSRERLFVYLDSLNFTFENIKQVCCFAYEYFAEYEEILNIGTIDGYVNIYLLQKKIISSAELYDFFHKK